MKICNREKLSDHFINFLGVFDRFWIVLSVNLAPHITIACNMKREDAFFYNKKDDLCSLNRVIEVAYIRSDTQRDLNIITEVDK